MYDYSNYIANDDVAVVKKLLKGNMVSPHYFTKEDAYITPIATAAHYGAIGCLILLCSQGALATQKHNTLSPLAAVLVSDQPRHIKIQMLKILQENGCRF